MPNQPFQRTPGRNLFSYTGMSLRTPPDRMRPGTCQLLYNVSAEHPLGAISSRPGLVNYTPSQATAPGHSYAAVGSSLTLPAQPVTRYLGAANDLWRAFDSGGFVTKIDSGYSGNPMTFCTSKPYSSPETWLYVGDSVRSRKIRPSTGTVQNHGILPPTIPPDCTENALAAYVAVDGAAAGGWGATAGGPVTSIDRVPASTTVASIVYDLPAQPSWATIQPSVGGDWLGVGAQLSCNGVNNMMVSEVFPLLTGTTVAAFTLDPSMAGVYVITPADYPKGLKRNALITVNGAASRVLSITDGPDESYSIRCTLLSAPSVGAAISIPASFRTYVASSVTLGGAITSKALSAPVASTGTYTFYAFQSSDMTKINGVNLGPDDYMHVSLRVSAPANLTEIHILLDCDPSTNDFTRNYFYYVARQSDIQTLQSATGNITATTLTALTNDLTGIEQLPAANAQWFEALFHVNDLIRVGTDDTVGLNTIKALGIQIITTGGLTVDWGSWWVGGGYGPDTNWNSYGPQGQPIQYRYRYRSSLTGAFSDVSPATRNGENVKRQAVSVYVTASADPQVDRIDLERFGGTNNSWHRVAEIPNTTGWFLDVVRETIAAASDPLELLQYTPWPITDIPRSGRCNVSGTIVTIISGDSFNLNYIRGDAININGQVYTLYAPPYSSTVAEVEQNIGNLSSVSWIMPEPTIIGRPLPFIAGPWDGRLWGSGDTLNPGILYFTNSYNPDTVSDRGYIEVTDPNEGLRAPILYDSVLFAPSVDNMYRVEATPNGVNPYTAYKLPGAPGLFAAWAYNADGPLLVYLAKDGIYSIGNGGVTENLTAADLAPLFPNESRPALPVALPNQTLFPPDFNSPGTLRIGYSDQRYYFTYRDTASNFQTLVYSLITKGWVLHNYYPQISLHLQEPEPLPPPGSTASLTRSATTICLGIDGSVNTFANVGTDNTFGITSTVITPADDSGETRARKQYGDVLFDLVGGALVTQFYDNFLLPQPNFGINSGGSRSQVVVDLADATSLHRNIGFIFSWAASAGTILYEWQPSFLPGPEDTQARVSDWNDGGSLHYKFVRGCRILADTGGVPKQVQIQYDGGLLGPILTINHNGQTALPYSFPPFKGHMMRLVPVDSTSWRFWGVDWEFDNEPDPTGYWVTQPTSWGLPGFLHMRDLQFAFASIGANASLTMLVDGISYVVAGGLPNTNGQEIKSYFAAPPVKGKLWQLYAVGVGLQVYSKDCEFRVKPWGGQQYQILKPVGDDTVTSGGARI